MDFGGPTLDAELGTAGADKRKVALLFAVWTLHHDTLSMLFWELSVSKDNEGRDLQRVRGPRHQVP